MNLANSDNDKGVLKHLFSSAPIYPDQGTAIVRIIVGALLIYHGQEVFHPRLMAEYMTWDIFSGSNARLLVYAGKTSELLAGLLILPGFLTRLGALLTVGTFLYITFFVGGGRFWYEDQHPFLFALFGLLFLFTGPGAWSIDRLTDRKR